MILLSNWYYSSAFVKNTKKLITRITMININKPSERTDHGLGWDCGLANFKKPEEAEEW